MRIKAIELEWFRGAAETIRLDPDSKSMVVYGENGAGKSCFVDAVEYILGHGKLGHLAHEYSGKHQEKGLINTHTPAGKKAEVRILFEDETVLRTEINRDGSSSSSGAAAAAMDTWAYRRTVLRQDEVAAFIRDTKGAKYSALLPLLGLHEMEVTAENLRQLAKTIDQQSRLAEARVLLSDIAEKRAAHFGPDTDDQIAARIEALHRRYCSGSAAARDTFAQCESVEVEIQARIARFSADQRRHLTLTSVATVGLREALADVRSKSVDLAAAAEPLIAERLNVLEYTRAFVEGLGDEPRVECPACGQLISASSLRKHVAAEWERHKALLSPLNSRKIALGKLCDALSSLKASLGKPELATWRSEATESGLVANLSSLDRVSLTSLRDSCDESGLASLEKELLPLVDAAASAILNEPPEVAQLSTDKSLVDAAKAVIKGAAQTAAVAGAQELITFINALEKGAREEIRLRSQEVIDEISSDILSMWTTLHPGEMIDGIRLYLPTDADKAIDIGLKFHGVEQSSPRLTLSEGFRNSLGLCIFLAMAKKESDKDRPIFLDDVVVSVDRNHRGMIVDLLESDFGDRQVILLTHDRDWYTELRQRLDGSAWRFKALMPYVSPEIGIRWSSSVSTFDDARAQLNDRPDAAGNTARKIMDIELALLAERVRIRVPYLHRERNDHRTAHDFLSQLISEGERCFQRKVGETQYERHDEAIAAFREADKLLLAWGNRASHSFDVSKNEATRLIDVCESSLKFFDCSACKTRVHRLDDPSSELVQCRCAGLRWRYGKA